MMTNRVILAGGSGFLGTALAPMLTSAGYEPVVLTRSPKSSAQVHWDGKTLGDWAALIDGAAAIVNLTGKSVNCRYTPENKREIIESRVDSVQVLADAVSKAKTPPPVWVQSASLAIYGNPGDRVCDESAPIGSGFSVDVCLAWEKAFNEVNAPGTRKVLLRIGFALGLEGGALETLAGLTRWFMGGTVGSGRQYISWLHVEDLNRIFLQSIKRPELEGMYNATGPTPVTNAEFMRTLRQVLHRPWSPPVPAPMVRLGAMFMGTEGELALTGRRCIPARLETQAFQFNYRALSPTLTEIFSSN